MVVIGCILIAAIVFIFVALHGFLNIKGFNNKSFTYSSLTDDLVTSSTNKASGSFNLLASGKHTVQLTKDDTGIETHYVNIPYFFGTSTIKRNNSSSKIQVVGRGVQAQLAMTPTGLIGWNSAGLIQQINQSSIDNSDSPSSTNVFFPNFDATYQVNSHYIGGVVKADDQYIPMYYDTITGDNFSYDAIQANNLSSKQESTGFSVYSNKKIQLYTPNNSKPKIVTTNETISNYNNNPLYSLTSKTSVIVTGGNLSSINENEDVKTPEANLKLSVIDNTLGKTVRTKQFGSTQVQDILLSPDGKLIFIKTNQSMAIYTTGSFEIVYMAPFTISQFMWIDSDKFTFATTDKGLFIGTASKKEASTIVSYSLVRPTQLSFIDNDWIYFTGYPGDDEGSQNSDAYRASTKDTQTGFDNKVLEKFPYQGDGYYVDYINNRFIVQLTKYISSSGENVSEEDKQKANDYIFNTVGSSVPSTDIIYTYVVTDLRSF